MRTAVGGSAAVFSGLLWTTNRRWLVEPTAGSACHCAAVDLLLPLEDNLAVLNGAAHALLPVEDDIHVASTRDRNHLALRS